MVTSSCHVRFFNLSFFFSFDNSEENIHNSLILCAYLVSRIIHVLICKHTRKTHHFSDLGLFALLFLFAHIFNAHFLFCLVIFFISSFWKKKWVKEILRGGDAREWEKKMKINKHHKIIILGDRWRLARDSQVAVFIENIQ